MGILGDHKRYKRMRPSWPAYFDKFIVGKANGRDYVSDGIWLIVDTILPDNERKDYRVERRDIDAHPDVARQLTSLEGCFPAEYFFANRERVVLRSEKRDVLVEACSAKWIERHCGEGQWHAGGPLEPARYVVDGRIVALLMLRKADAFDARRDMGLDYDGTRFGEVEGLH